MNSASRFLARQFDILKILVPEMLKNYYSTPRQTLLYHQKSVKKTAQTGLVYKNFLLLYMREYKPVYSLVYELNRLQFL